VHGDRDATQVRRPAARCRGCGRYFRQGRRKRLFCSNKCYLASVQRRRLRKAVCVVCGRTFSTTKRKERAFCKKCGRALLIERMAFAESYKAKIPSEPTSHLPGSDEKIEVMRARVERGESPFHPDDRLEPSCEESTEGTL